ncbi:MAG: TlpA family protein disulfide reductase, partial [Acidobacteriaceae bacterium]|nr:TlpA family protein disulfide reductase [Acidobacteriaceae bacterium]
KAVKINIALRGALLLLAFSFIGVVAYSLRDTSAKEGGPAPEFTIQTDSGAQVTPTSFRGKVLVLNFWATWCAPCIQEIPSLNQFQKRFADSGVKVLAISIDKNEGKYKNFLDHVHVSFDTARDPSMDISTKYGTFQYPETYIIKNGRIMRKFPNAANWLSDDIIQYVQSLL